EGQREEELSGAAQPAEWPLPAAQLRAFDVGIAECEGRRGVPGIHGRIRLRSIEQWPKLPVVAITPSKTRVAAHFTPDGRRRQFTNRNPGAAIQVSLKR